MLMPGRPCFVMACVVGGFDQGKLLGLRLRIAQCLKPQVLLFVSSKDRAEAVYE